jgi:hypothetical protein
MKKLKYLIIVVLIAVVVLSCYNNYDMIKNKVETIFNKGLVVANKTGLDLIDATGNLISDSEAKNLNDSGISGDDYNFDTTYYPYYGFLNDNEKNLYRKIYANVSSMETTFVPNSSIGVKEVQKVVESVFNDHPELFWLDTSYSYKYTKDGNCVQLIMEFNKTAKNIDSAKREFDKSANSIINKASNLNSNYEKEKYVHDAIIKLVEYDESASMNQSAYSTLVGGRSVCAGYARAFQYIMIKLGIPTYYCTGYASGDHAWNIIKLSDGYYNVDLTWDDDDNISYKYFNVTDYEFSKTHKRDDNSSLLPKCSASGYIYKNNSNNSNKKDYTTSNSSSNNSNSSNNNSKNNYKDTKENSVSDDNISNNNETDNIDNDNLIDNENSDGDNDSNDSSNDNVTNDN